MSHLLCLYSFEVARFVNVFGAGNATVRDALVSSLPPQIATSKTQAAVTNAVNRGLAWKDLASDEKKAVEWAVHHALTTKKFGINRKPISPMGAGGAIFDDLQAAFEEAGATELFEVLQRGRNYEDACILLSPEDVKLAAKQLKSVAEDDADGYLTSELLEPFARAATKNHAIYGNWG
jgi:hypothetical protein